jgi:uroporphyrinogen-III synthase
VTRGDVLVLRPQPGADETVAALEEAGIAARAMPVLDIEAMPDSPALRACVQDLDHHDAVIFVSPAAVRHGLRWIDRYWPQYPLRVRWFAVGARTAAELAAHGIRALVPDGDERAEGLLALRELQAGEVHRVLVVRGEGGRALLAEELAARGATVAFLEVYRRRPRAVALPPLAQVRALVVSSGEVLEACLATGGAGLRTCPLVVPSERVAAGAREAGFTCVEVAAGAGPFATIEALRRLGVGTGSTGAAQ